MGKVMLESRVLIDLDRSGDVIRLNDDSQFIQQDAYDRLKSLVKRFLNEAENYEPEDDQTIFRTRTHNAITIAGSRGSGKTTFVTNFFERIAEKNKNGDHEVNVAVLGVIDPTLIEFIEWNERAGVWETGYRLRPESADADLGIISLVFAARFAQVFRRSPAAALSFMATIGLARELILARPESLPTKAIIHYLGLDTHERTTTVSRRAVAAQRSYLKARTALSRGTIPVAGAKIDTKPMMQHLYFGRSDASQEQLIKEFRAKQKNLKSDVIGAPPIAAWWSGVRAEWENPHRTNTLWKGYIYNTFEGLTQHFKGAMLANLTACIVMDRRGQNTTYLSVFNLISAMAELLALAQGGPPNEEIVSTHLSQLCQLRSYPMPSWDMSSDDASQELDDEADDFGKSGKIEQVDFPSGLLDYLRAWIAAGGRSGDGREPEFNLSPWIYARIITRLYYTLSRIDEALDAKDLYTGRVLHRQIIAFLNAVLVEEVLARGSVTRMPVLANPTTSDQAFWSNYRTFIHGNDTKSGTADLRLFKLMFSCPLLGFFLEPEVDVFEGNKVVKWKLLEEQLASWPSVEDASEGKRASIVRSVRGDISFDNLWAPLNSVPLLKSNFMSRPIWEHSARTSKPKDRPKASEELHEPQSDDGASQ